jgi:hypothetical protein
METEEIRRRIVEMAANSKAFVDDPDLYLETSRGPRGLRKVSFRTWDVSTPFVRRVRA